MGILARQAGWNAALGYVGLVLGFINVVILYPKFLSADEFGLTRLLVSIATITAQVAQLGMDNTLIRYFPYFKDGARQHNGILGIMLGIGTLGALLAGLVVWAMHGHFMAWFGTTDGLYGDFGLYVLPFIVSEVYFFLLHQLIAEIGTCQKQGVIGRSLEGTDIQVFGICQTQI